MRDYVEIKKMVEGDVNIYFVSLSEAELAVRGYFQFEVTEEGFTAKKDLRLIPFGENSTKERDVQLKMNVSDWTGISDTGEILWYYIAGEPFNKELRDKLLEKVGIGDEEAVVLFGYYDARNHIFTTEPEFPTHVGILTKSPLRHFAGMNNYNLYEDDKTGMRFMAMPKQAAVNLANGIRRFQ